MLAAQQLTHFGVEYRVQLPARLVTEPDLLEGARLLDPQQTRQTLVLGLAGAALRIAEAEQLGHRILGLRSLPAPPAPCAERRLPLVLARKHLVEAVLHPVDLEDQAHPRADALAVRSIGIGDRTGVLVEQRSTHRLQQGRLAFLVVARNHVQTRGEVAHPDRGPKLAKTTHIDGFEPHGAHFRNASCSRYSTCSARAAWA